MVTANLVYFFPCFTWAKFVCFTFTWALSWCSWSWHYWHILLVYLLHSTDLRTGVTYYRPSPFIKFPLMSRHAGEAKRQRGGGFVRRNTVATPRNEPTIFHWQINFLLVLCISRHQTIKLKKNWREPPLTKLKMSNLVTPTNKMQNGLVHRTENDREKHGQNSVHLPIDLAVNIHSGTGKMDEIPS